MDFVITVGLLGIAVAALLKFMGFIGGKDAAKYGDKSSELQKLLDENEVLIVTTQTVPGKEIVKVIGHVTGNSKIMANSQSQAETAELEAKLDLATTAAKRGANAVVDAKLNTSSFEQLGSQWMVAKTMYTGTAVVVR